MKFTESVNVKFSQNSLNSSSQSSDSAANDFEEPAAMVWNPFVSVFESLLNKFIYSQCSK